MQKIATLFIKVSFYCFNVTEIKRFFHFGTLCIIRKSWTNNGVMRTLEEYLSRTPWYSFCLGCFDCLMDWGIIYGNPLQNFATLIWKPADDSKPLSDVYYKIDWFRLPMNRPRVERLWKPLKTRGLCDYMRIRLGCEFLTAMRVKCLVVLAYPMLDVYSCALDMIPLFGLWADLFSNIWLLFAGTWYKNTIEDGIQAVYSLLTMVLLFKISWMK